jgi:hypothetical protein
MELKVGMYVRTKEGYIAKLLHYRYNTGISGKSHLFDRQIRDISDLVYETDNFLWDKELKEYIKNYSYDILDLIEAGDYVNGYKVSLIDCDYKPFVQCDYPVQNGVTNHYKFYKKSIKSIVTKEQFENMEYKI